MIGTRAERSAKERALDHVAAYGCFNDISASEIIKADGHFDRGKNFASFGPFGPFLAFARRGRPTRMRLSVTLKVDGRIMQSGSTRDMLFGVADLISFSLGATSRSNPATSSPRAHRPAWPAMHKPPAWLKPGSTVEVEVEKLWPSRSIPIIEGPAPDA